MKTYDISKTTFKKLDIYTLERNVTNTECKLYKIPTKDKWLRKFMLLKMFYVTLGNGFNNKIKTINSLMRLKENIEIDGLVMPEQLATIEGKTIGYTMPLIDSSNLKTILNNLDVGVDKKINYLKQIGELLEQLKDIRNHHGINEFFLNDIHESNFIVEKETDKVYAVDIDSCKIDGNKTFPSKFLSGNNSLKNINKYRYEQNDIIGKNIIPDENTDLYCYNMIVLNFLSNSNMHYSNISEFYDYLNYLRDLNLDKELCDAFAKLYTEDNNENIYELLDAIKEVYPRTIQSVYKKVRR